MKNKKRTILCVLMATVFIIPLIGTTAMAATTDYYFGSYDPWIAWDYNPWYMADGYPDTFASTGRDGDVELLYGPVTDGAAPQTITKVEIRACGFYTGGQQGNITLLPIFRSGSGNYHLFVCPKDNPGYSDWFDITDDQNAPDPWTVDDVHTLQCEVESHIEYPAGPACLINCSIVEIRVTWT